MSPPSLVSKGDYRPDIDGLRAMAVLAVVCYHAFPAWMHGGFIGVDIFFVISGYLISKHIWEDLAAGTFSIKAFYARRIRRIFPALGVVLSASLVAGWIILSPGEYEQLGKHVEGGAGFVSNLIYWKEAGYFDNAADTKPLLHLWSLGIEEQFYIAWPLILAFLWRQPHHAGWVLPGVLAVSLAYSLVLVRHDAVADFYSPFSRFWELALGAVLAHQTMQRLALNGWQRSGLAGLGLALILTGIVTLDSHDPFPGYWALLPALGAALLIQAGEGAWLNRRLLACRGLVWVGLISYPLYLWHWPLLSFARIMEAATPAPEVRFMLLMVGGVLAWLTYKLVETPIRRRARSRQVIVMLCLGMLILAVAGESVRKLDGFKSRKLDMLNADPATLVLGADRARMQHECGLGDEQKKKFEYCLQSAPHANYALLGDSKGEALLYGLVRESSPGMEWLMLGSVHPPGARGTGSAMQEKNQLAWQQVEQTAEIRGVVLAVALRGIVRLDERGFIASPVPPGVLEQYSLSIARLEQAGKRVVFVMDNPTFPDPRSCIRGGLTSSEWLNQFLYRKENPYCTMSHESYLAGTRVYREFVGALQQRHPAMVVYDPTPLLCEVAKDRCAVTREGKFLYSYGDHISDAANSILARDMMPMLRGLAH